MTDIVPENKIKDENLRLILSGKEREYIETTLRKELRDIVLAVAALVSFPWLPWLLFRGDVSIADQLNSTFGGSGLLVALIGAIAGVVVPPVALVLAMKKAVRLHKYRGYDRDLHGFLEKYNRL